MLLLLPSWRGCRALRSLSRGYEVVAQALLSYGCSSPLGICRRTTLLSLSNECLTCCELNFDGRAEEKGGTRARVSLGLPHC